MSDVPLLKKFTHRLYVRFQRLDRSISIGANGWGNGFRYGDGNREGNPHQLAHISVRTMLQGAALDPVPDRGRRYAQSSGCLVDRAPFFLIGHGFQAVRVTVRENGEGNRYSNFPWSRSDISRHRDFRTAD